MLRYSAGVSSIMCAHVYGSKVEESACVHTLALFSFGVCVHMRKCTGSKISAFFGHV